MTDKDSFKKSFGQRMRARRVELGWSLKQLSEKTGIHPDTLGRYEKGYVFPLPDNLHKITKALAVDVEDLTVGSSSKHFRVPKKNPKPVCGWGVDVESAFILIGNHTNVLDVIARYAPKPLRLPRKLKPFYEELLSRASAAARGMGYPLFDGPNTRLIRATQENTRQDAASGKEVTGIVLELGPVSFFDFTVLNTFLDEDLFSSEEQNTIRKVFADYTRLYEEAPDLSWCQLSNIMTVIMTPITTDGYGLIQYRNRHGVSTGGGQYGTGVAENIHRYLDEAPVTDLNERLNELVTAASRPVDANYEPRGVPSPLLAAQRGLWEEISAELYSRIRGAPGRFKFLNLVMDLVGFNPHLAGVIELGFTREEVQQMVREHPGKDHSETIEIKYVDLSIKEIATKAMLADATRWIPVSLGCVVTAIHYWQSRRRFGKRLR